MTRPKHKQDARAWITAYLDANWRSMTPSQIKALRTLRRDPQTKNMTVTDLTGAMRFTIKAPIEKPIRQIGPISAAYILSLLE